MNTRQLVYALSEKSRNDFRIRNARRSHHHHRTFGGAAHDTLHDNDSDSTVDDGNSANDHDRAGGGKTDDNGGANSSSAAPPQQDIPEPLDMTPQFFQINKEEVVMLSNEKGSHVYVLGTNHASPESRLAVDSLIKTINPQIVVVELCKTRIGLNPLRTFERNRAFNLYLLKDAVTELGISAGFIWYSMAYMERFISRLLNVDYGGDMRAPGTSSSFQVTNADLLEGRRHNYKIMLGDRPIEVTIKRMASILTFPEKVAIWFFNICSAVLGLRCYLLNVPTVLFRSPKFNHVLLDERDVYLTYSLQMAANIADGPVRVIGIVGKAHVPGILRRWETVSEEEVRRITSDDVR